MDWQCLRGWREASLRCRWSRAAPLPPPSLSMTSRSRLVLLTPCRLCANFGCIAIFVVVVAAAVLLRSCCVRSACRTVRSMHIRDWVGRGMHCTVTRSCLYIDVCVFDLRMCTFACVCVSCWVLPQLLSYAYMDLVATTSRGAGGQDPPCAVDLREGGTCACLHAEASQVPFAPQTHSAHTTARCLLRGGGALEN